MPGRIKPLPTPNTAAPLTAKLIGQFVKARRTQANLRIDDAAMLCGIAKDRLSKIENGRDTVQLGSVLQVMQQLGIQLQIQPWDEGT